MAGPAFNPAEFEAERNVVLEERRQVIESQPRSLFREAFDAAMRVSDMTGIMGVVPPAVLDEIAKQNNITSEQLIAAAQQQIDAAMANITLVSFGMELDKAEYKTNDELTDVVPNRLVLVSCYRPAGYDPGAATVQNIVVVLQLDQEKTNVGC